MQTCQFRESNVGDSMLNPPARVWSLCVVAALRSVPGSMRSTKQRGLHDYLAHAECDGGISEFHALIIQALLAMSEDSDFAIDYLDMAEAIATTSYERDVIAETRAARAWLQANRAATTAYIQACLVDDCRAMELWNNLLVALCRLGDSGNPERRELLDPRAA